jgi:hypothetical protein
MKPFYAHANGRLFRIAPGDDFRSCDDDWMPVDCRDVRARVEAQAIILASKTTPREIVSDHQVQDAIRSAWGNAQRFEPALAALPGSFDIAIQSTITVTAPDPDTRTEQE